MKNMYYDSDILEALSEEQGIIYCPLFPLGYGCCKEDCEHCEYNIKYINSLRKDNR